MRRRARTLIDGPRRWSEREGKCLLLPKSIPVGAFPPATSCSVRDVYAIFNWRNILLHFLIVYSVIKQMNLFFYSYGTTKIRINEFLIIYTKDLSFLSNICYTNFVFTAPFLIFPAFYQNVLFLLEEFNYCQKLLLKMQCNRRHK